MNWQQKHIENLDCDGCRHRYCQDCEECSASKQHSDFWICHRCGELNRRVQRWNKSGVLDGFGQDQSEIVKKSENGVARGRTKQFAKINDTELRLWLMS